MKKIKIKAALATIALSTLTASGYAEKAIQIIDSAKISSDAFVKATLGSESTTLGRGYLANAMIPLQMQCIKKMGVSFKDVKSYISLERSTNLNKIASSLNVNLKAKGGWGKFTADGTMDYLREIKEDDYSISFTLQDVVLGYATLDSSDYFGEEALSSGALHALKQSEDAFIARCGDQYIRGANMGAVLNVTVLIKFHDQNQKKQVEATLEGKFGDIFSSSGSIKKLFNANGVIGSVEVIAYQTGGAPHYLSEIFGSDKKHGIIHCDKDNLDLCSNALDDILDYAQANGSWKETGFAKQIKIKDGQLIADSLSIIGLRNADIGSYQNDFGLNVSLKPASAEVKAARLELNKLYDANEEEFSFSRSILSSKIFNQLDTDVKNTLKNNARDIQENIELFQTEKAINCFLPTTQDTCTAIVSTIKKQLSPIDLSLFNQLKGAYYFNVSYNWPAILVKNDAGEMDFYTMNMKKVDLVPHNLRVVPSLDFSYISMSGGYSTYLNGIQTRYYMGYYGSEDLIYKNTTMDGYSGLVPWNTCVGGNCYKSYYNVVLLSF